MDQNAYRKGQVLTRLVALLFALSATEDYRWQVVRFHYNWLRLAGKDTPSARALWATYFPEKDYPNMRQDDVSAAIAAGELLLESFGQ